MDYKEEFTKYVEENKYEDARIALEKLKIYANDDPFYYANMGWILNHLERYQEAELMLRKGISLFPEDAWMYSQLGFCLDRQGKVDEGLKLLLESLQRGFDEAWIHGEIGWCYKEKQEYKNAINHFEDGLMDEERNVFLLSQAAFCYMRIGDMNTAEDYYKKSYLYSPDDDSIYDLANFYRENKNYEKEIEYLKRLSDGNDNPSIQFELGCAYSDIEDYEHALDHLLHALRLGRDDTGIRARLGDVYSAMHQIKEANIHYDIALQYYEKALTHEEDTYWIFQEMIWIAHKQHDPHKKLEYLNRASEKHDMTLWLMYHYARCYSDLEDYKRAADCCSYCMEHGETTAEMYDLYAWNLGRCGKEEKAVEVLKKRIKSYGEDDWSQGELGWNYAQLSKYQEAKDCFLKAASMAHENISHISMCGWCCLRLNQYEEAHAYVQKALDLGRKDGWIHSVLAEINEGEEDYEAAIKNFKYAIDHDYDEAWIHKEIHMLKTKIKDKKE